MVEELSGRPPEHLIPDSDILQLNITAGKTIAEMIRTTLGPRGMDKMLVDRDGMVIITNDGYTLLGQMNVDVDLVPAAKLLVELAKSQDESVGDGTTTAVLLAGELLRETESLIDRGIHPTVITRGYQLAAETFSNVSDANAISVAENDTKTLQEVAQIVMSGTGSYVDDEILANRVVEAAQLLAANSSIRFEDLVIQKVPGGTIADTSISQSLLLDIQPVHVNMPRRIEPARIACLTTELNVNQPMTDVGEIRIRNADDYEDIREYENQNLHSILETLKVSGANVVFSNESISEEAQSWLAEQGILAARRVATSDLKSIAQATEAMLTADVTSLEIEDLGTANVVEQYECGADNLLAIRTGDNTTRPSLILRGGAEHVLDEMERAVKNGLGALEAMYRDPRVVPGGGALETVAALSIRERAEGIAGREQLAMQAYANALETIPRTLAENSGIDPLDGIIELRRRNATGQHAVGIDAIYGRFDDVIENNIVEPARTKERLVANATEVVNQILVIDEVLAASRDD